MEHHLHTAPANKGRSPRITRSFSMMADDVAIISEVREKEGLGSDSAALGMLIRLGKRYWDIREGLLPVTS